MNKIKMDLTKELPYAVEESINRLRINVSFLGNEIKKIMVVSTMPNEGKSFVTLQMWKQMAMALIGIGTVLSVSACGGKENTTSNEPQT